MGTFGWILFILSAITLGIVWQGNQYAAKELKRGATERLNDYAYEKQAEIDETNRRITKMETIIAQKEASSVDLDEASLRSKLSQLEAQLATSRSSLSMLRGDIENVSSIWRDIQAMKREAGLR